MLLLLPPPSFIKRTQAINIDEKTSPLLLALKKLVYERVDGAFHQYSITNIPEPSSPKGFHVTLEKNALV